MAERRYDDDEVREILLRATEFRSTDVDADATALPAPIPAAQGPGHGLTLAQLQEVAAEAGIAPARVAEAAGLLELDRAALPAPRTLLGVDISTAHAVRLPRMLEPDEWDRYVVRLRDAFGAAGQVRTEGSLQTWSNGHLKVLLEPLETGARLRFQALHGESKGFLDGAVALGVSGLFLGVFLGGMTLLTGKPLPGILFGITASLPVVGAGMWAAGRSRAARWLPRRRTQFRTLGEEALRVVERDGGRLGPGSP